MSDLDEFWIHPVTVETYLGQATDGSDAYAPATTVTGFLDEGVRWVRGADGIETVSSSTFYAPAGAIGFAAGSRVTTPSGRVTQVLTVSRQDSGPLELPDHVVVNLA